MNRIEHYIAADQILAKVNDVHPTMVESYLAEAHIHALLATAAVEPPTIPMQRSRTEEWLEASR